LAVGTLGVVHGSSKKQRVAKATMKSSQAAAAAVAEANRVAARQAVEEREFRYATDPVYRKYIDEKQAAEESARRASAEQAARAARLKRERRRQRWDTVKSTLSRPASASVDGNGNGAAIEAHAARAQAEFERGKDRAAVKEIEAGRKLALKRRDVDALHTLLLTTRSLAGHAENAPGGKLQRLEYAISQNIAQVDRTNARN
jgi:hypothetical protein